MQKFVQKMRNAAYIRNMTTFQYLHVLSSIKGGCWLSTYKKNHFKGSEKSKVND